MKDFFVSYNKADRAWAEWIAWQLEEAGYTTILQAWDFRPSSNFVLNMQKATIEAERTIAVLSPDYIASNFTQPEWAAAFAKDPTGENGLLLPIRVRECNLGGLLPQIVYIDFVGLEEEATKKQLLEGILRARVKPSSPPNFPVTTLRAFSKQPRFPGTLPPIWNVPHNRNPNFTGREEILTSLRSTLLTNQSISLVQAIHGLGGIGKTQIAVEYAYCNSIDYDIVWWIRAEEFHTLSADFSTLAKELNLQQQETKDQRIVIEVVRKWLGQHTRWLLIFDNAKEPAVIKDYIPQSDSGHVIVTSRNPNWKGIGDSIPVHVLSREESIGFLKGRTGQDDDKCGELAEELGDLPLALEQAGAYIEETGKSITEYLQLFRTYQVELLSLGNISTNYPASVRTTWEVSFQQAVKESSSVTGVLALLGFLAPDSIPQSLLYKIVEISTNPDDRTQFSQLNVDGSVATLRRYSLLEIIGSSLSIHRLFQAISRDYLKNLSENLAAGIVGIINSVFPLETEDARKWSECAALLPHALVAMNYAEKLNQVFYPMAELLNKVATYFIARAEYENAKQALERALQIVKRIYGDNSTSVADIRTNLGQVYHHLGENSIAIHHLSIAMEINEREKGKDNESVGALLNNFGLIYTDTGKYIKALASYIRANEIAKASYGPDDPRVAITLDNIGCVFGHLGYIDYALSYFERALKIDVAYYGPDHPQVAIHLSHIANAYVNKGQPSRAVKEAKRALQIRETYYESTHPLIAFARLSLGFILRELNDITGARNQLTQGLAVLVERLGVDNSEVTEAQKVLNELSPPEE
ncbi:MAG TPA: FxSxx-COOH system tetratricopeptide repeat protein [Pyrinomonadaceae bacterium]|jgi:tetratricopeptide (TPR) repeat protein